MTSYFQGTFEFFMCEIHTHAHLSIMNEHGLLSPYIRHLISMSNGLWTGMPIRASMKERNHDTT